MAAKAEFEMCGAAAGDYPDFEFRVGQTHLVRDDDDCWYRASIQKLESPVALDMANLNFIMRVGPRTTTSGLLFLHKI